MSVSAAHERWLPGPGFHFRPIYAEYMTLSHSHASIRLGARLVEIQRVARRLSIVMYVQIAFVVVAFVANTLVYQQIHVLLAVAGAVYTSARFATHMAALRLDRRARREAVFLRVSARDERLLELDPAAAHIWKNGTLLGVYRALFPREAELTALQGQAQARHLAGPAVRAFNLPRWHLVLLPLSSLVLAAAFVDAWGGIDALAAIITLGVAEYVSSDTAAAFRRRFTALAPDVVAWVRTRHAPDIDRPFDHQLLYRAHPVTQPRRRPPTPGPAP
jgi:hypothetical protein